MSADGGHAFPSPGVILSDGSQQGAYEGMSLRDYFMAHAPITLNDAAALIPIASINLDADRRVIMALLSVMRAEYADAMLAEREK